MRVVNVLIGAVLEAGFTGAEAARMYRALGDFTLAWAGSEAAFLALDPALQETDRSAWTRAYLAVDRAQYPNTWQIRDELAGVSPDDIFETILGLVMAGFVATAPRPCRCENHEGAADDDPTAAGTMP
jgi:hypothetical protein